MIRSRGTVSSAIIVAFTAGTIGTALATEAPRPSSRPHLLVPRQGGHDHPTQVDTATTSVRTNGLEVRITLNAAGSRYVGTTVPIKGHLRGNTEGVRKRIVVQSKSDGVWRDRAQRFQRRLGVYRLPAQEITRPGTSRFRTVVWARGEMLDVSRVMSVRGVALPTQTPLPTLTPSPTPASMPTPTAEPTPLPTLTPSPTPTTTTTPTPEPTPTPTPTPEPTPTPTPTPEPTPTPTPTPEPESITEKRTIDGAITCEHLRVAVLHQERTSVWTWDPAAGRWVLSWTPWDTVSTTSREAAAADCVNVVERTSADVLLPDIRMKNLDACGASERELSGGSCFRIVNPAPANSSFPHLTGKKLLKFPVITLNVGTGPSELVADRSSPTSSTWRAYQTFLRPNGDRESVVLPGAEFYYAGDGHRHWHVRDFDDYSLLDADGETVRTAEKHGYCLQDNTRYTPMRGEPGVPEEPVYPDATQCGKGLPDALAVIHGMSKGWGDTYSSALPDQALDISGVPDGEYVVELTADANNHIRETNEENNTASIRVVITGDTVAMVPGSATGGLD